MLSTFGKAHFSNARSGAPPLVDFSVWERTELYFAGEVGHPPGIGSLGFAGGPTGIITTPAGAATGSLVGGGVGWASGMIYCAKGAGPKFRGNQRQNKAANDAKRDAERETGKRMSADQEEKFHDLITKQGFDYGEMVKIAVAILSGEAY
jgi:hypothetical protein